MKKGGIDLDIKMTTKKMGFKSPVWKMLWTAYGGFRMGGRSTYQGRKTRKSAHKYNNEC